MRTSILITDVAALLAIPVCAVPLCLGIRIIWMARKRKKPSQLKHMHIYKP